MTHLTVFFQGMHPCVYRPIVKPTCCKSYINDINLQNNVSKVNRPVLSSFFYANLFYFLCRVKIRIAYVKMFNISMENRLLNNLYLVEINS